MTAFGAILLRPVLPITLVCLTTVIVGLVSWYTYTRCALGRRQIVGLWCCRMGAVVITGWLLLQPQRREVTYQIEPPVLAVAVDISASMEEKIPRASELRSERALEFLTDGKVRRALDDFRVVYYELGAEVEESAGETDAIAFNAPRSHIGSGINQILTKLRAENVAGVLLLSDGLDHSGESPAPQAKPVPIYVPELEEPIELADVADSDCWIGEVSYPRMMVVNWKASVDVLVRRRGAGKMTFPIHFRQGSRVLRTSMVQFEEDEQFKQVSFSVEPLEVGQILYKVEISPKQDGDAENNSRDFLIEVTDPKNRVLYLEGAPRWEFKFLKRAILSEKNYQLSAFVRGGDGAFINFSELSGTSGGGTPSFEPENLRLYKVVILGDLPGSAAKDEEWRNLRDFVERGGGLLMVGAANAYGSGGLHTASYLEELFPAQAQAGAKMNEGRFSVDLTATGRAHPALSGLPQEMRLPPVLSFWAPVQVSPFSSVLIATADGSPVLVTRRYGQGRTAMLLSDTLWRWQLAAGEDLAEKTLYNRFVTQLVYWLAPSEKDVEKTAILQVITAKSEFEMREEVTVGAVYEQPGDDAEALSAKITTPEGRRLTFPMVAGSLGTDVGLSRTMDGFKCVFTPKSPGKYMVSVSTPDGTQEKNVLLLVTQPEHERTGAPIARDYLQSLAKNSSGRFVAWRKRYDMLKDIPCKPKEVQIVEEYPLWNRWWWLVILIALFCGEWWWRRQLDLV